MQVLITGGGGNLGRRVAGLFVGSGDAVRILELPQVDCSVFDRVARVEVVKGDVRDEEAVRRAVDGVDAILHLAALAQPSAKRNHHLAMAVNLGGTENLLRAADGTQIHFILASSVYTYGDTAAERPPVKVDHTQQAIDIYAQSRIECEQATVEAGLPYTVLRIALMAASDPADLPRSWPFQSSQRVELVSPDDVADALHACTRKPAVRGRTLIVAGGPTWQTLGRQYVCSVYHALHLHRQPVFSERPGAVDWYDTAESQVLLRYQNTSFSSFMARLRGTAAERAPVRAHAAVRVPRASRGAVSVDV